MLYLLAEALTWQEVAQGAICPVCVLLAIVAVCWGGPRTKVVKVTNVRKVSKTEDE